MPEFLYQRHLEVGDQVTGHTCTWLIDSTVLHAVFRFWSNFFSVFLFWIILPQCPPPSATSTFTKSKFTCPVHWERLLPSVVSVLSFLYDCTASAFADSYSYNDSLVWKWTKFSIKSSLFLFTYFTLGKKIKKKKTINKHNVVASVP